MSRHTMGWAAFLLVAGILVSVGWALARPRPKTVDRLMAEAASRGWIVEAADQKTGPFSSVLINTRLSFRQIPALTAEIAKVEVRHWPWFRPRITVSGVRARLAGEPASVLRAIGTLAGLGDDLTVGEVDAVYHHRVIGSVELFGLKGRFLGSNLLVDADRVQIGSPTWRSVTLAVEPRTDMVVIAPGDSVANARIRLSCFSPSGGTSRWLLDIAHQAARPLANGAGWDLGPGFDPTQIAGSLSLDSPDEASAPVRGRVQLVLDRLPTGGPAQAEHLMGQTVSFLSNVVPAPDGMGWDLPRAELTNLVFKLTGKGHIDLDAHPRLTLDAEGNRTCRLLRSLMAASDERGRVDRYLASRSSKSHAVEDEEIGLRLGWKTASPTENQPIWRLGGGCGLAAWTTPAPPGR